MTKEQFLEQHQADRDKPVTTGVLMDTLLEFTHEFFIPAISDVVDEKIKLNNAQQENSLKTYIDRKLADHTSELFKRLDKRYQQEKAFKEKVVDLFKKHHIGSPEDIAFLDGMVQAT